MLSITCVLLLPSSLKLVTPNPREYTPSQAVLQAPLLSTRLNPLTLTVTPPWVKVRMFPAVPSSAEFPSKMKVPATHVGAGVGVGVAVGAGVGVGVAVGAGVGVAVGGG